MKRFKGEFGYSWHHWAYKRYGCITGDNAGFFHIDGDLKNAQSQFGQFLLEDDNNDDCHLIISGCTKCEGGMEECLNTEAVLEYSR